MTEKLFVEIKTVYGTPKVYPACERAKLLAELAGTVTFTDASLAIVRKLGFQVFESPASAAKRRDLFKINAAA